MLRDGPAGEHHIVSRIPVRDRKNVDPVEMLPPPLKSGGSRQEGVPESLSVDTSNFHPQGGKNLRRRFCRRARREKSHAPRKEPGIGGKDRFLSSGMLR